MTLTADDDGKLEGVFTIPPDIPAGSKMVSFTGEGGTKGEALYVGRGTIVTRLLRRVFTTTIIRWDPLAQTFTLANSRHVTSLDVEFCKIGNRSNPVIAQIRETELGLPGDQVLAEAILDMTDVSGDEWTNVAFNSPVWLEANSEYALVFITDDPDHSLALAELGKFDKKLQSWVTEQPYQIGVLLSSSNARTWTPHQAMDLKFRLNAAKFTTNERVVDIGEIELANCSDLIVEAGIEEPAVDTAITVRLTRQDGSIIRMQPGQPIRFDEHISETVNIAFELKGSDIHSPVLYPSIQIIQGNLQANGDYISRAMPSTADVRALVTFDCLLPGSSGIEVEVGSPGNWQALSLVDVTPLGDGWQERTYKKDDYDEKDARIRLVLNGDPSARPMLRSLRANITDQPIDVTGDQ